MTDNARLRIDLWTDTACPWCYIGAARLERAVAASPHADQIDVVNHSFELDPDAPAGTTPLLEYLAKKMGTTVDQAVQMDARVHGLAEQEGLPYTSDRVHGNSFDAHRILHLANTMGLGQEVFREVQQGLFSGRQDAYEHSFLVEAAERVGIPRARAEEVLAGDEFAESVRQDEAQARRLGITGVPFAVVGGRYGIPGAVSEDGYAQVIEQAWNER